MREGSSERADQGMFEYSLFGSSLLCRPERGTLGKTQEQGMGLAAIWAKSCPRALPLCAQDACA
eukprot:CAMPEP_0195052524 /NCGR_PEP_ID=MMETSP0448-20130528/1859_1 /TAXON_ID=66468 /ORGANISM="Heterocapsa triquestra, Strain CCMP 448" /LENGTH=63 /DNA_ID=CAMNT_0040081679 /DNA_START=118 /DNA_END=306 /DNA_ORIENTATION=+